MRTASRSLRPRRTKGPGFNICVTDKSSFKDIDLTVSFKAVAGDIDQGGGWSGGFKDGDNYYVARMNPLEENFRLYKVVAGKRIQLESAKVIAEEGKWHTIRIVHREKRSTATSTARSTWMPRTTRFPTPARSACGPRPTPRHDSRG